MTIKNPIPCIVCGVELDHAAGGFTYPETEIIVSQPNNGVAFSTSGNYGSTLFDSIDGKERLEIVVCDECIRNNRDRTRILKILRESRYDIQVEKLEW